MPPDRHGEEQETDTASGDRIVAVYVVGMWHRHPKIGMKVAGVPLWP